MVEQQNYNPDPFISEVGVRIRDIEERQKIMKDRILLVGQNLIDFREKTTDDLIQLKQTVEIIKQDIKRIKDFVENISNETVNFARKSELEILQKQAKMFQPLNLVTRDEAKEIIEEEIKKHRVLV